MITEHFAEIFEDNKAIIGMIHLQALPGTAKNEYTPKEIIDYALAEAKIYHDTGFTGVLIENMHDVPYLKNNVGHEISTIVAIIGYEIKRRFGLSVGVQILAAANNAALAAAYSAGLDFVRVEGFVYGHMADEGYIDAQAGELLRYARSIGAEDIAIFTDLKKKHSAHAITADVSLNEMAKTADFFRSDGIIVTGNSTGEATDLAELKSVYELSEIPVLVGSGITAQNVKKYWNYADGFIIGSYFKENGIWYNPLDVSRISKFMEVVSEI